MIVRRIDDSIKNLNRLVIDVLACNDCGREAPETKALGGVWGNSEPWMAEQAGYTVRMRGALRVTLCPCCAAKAA